MGIFIYIEALASRHHVSVREHRTAIDWAEEIKYLVDVMYPDKEKFILVMDNFPPGEVRRIIRKLEIQ